MTEHQLSDLQVKVHSMSKQMAEFTALYESLGAQMQNRELRLQGQLQSYHQFIEEKMNNLELMLNDFEAVLTQAGAARWRLAAEESLQMGQAHLRALQETCESLNSQVQNACYGIEASSENATGKFMQAIQHLDLNEIKSVTQQSSEKVDKVSREAIVRIASVGKLFQWERLGLAVVVAVLSAVFTGMFINDESPIESHKKAMVERQAGKVLMAAWPNLSEAERERINQNASI